MKNIFLVTLLSLLNIQLFNAQKIDFKTKGNIISEKIEKIYPSFTFSNFIYVDIKQQQLFLVENRATIKKYNISTSKRGVGNKSNSLQTPIGLHKIKSKYGQGVPIGGILDHRKFNGEIASINLDTTSTGKDIICTRVIRIIGIEDGVNKGGEVDTYLRKIYLHGTNEEGLIGKESSHGCVRMKNQDIVDLFDRVKKDMIVVMLDNL
ncbi:MAG: L,D-transpeptidase [Flavobacteriales bacterium]|jgi:hypothetical protein|nr:L,D-transpeptidase [Flavobacteriales bacterium]